MFMETIMLKVAVHASQGTTARTTILYVIQAINVIDYFMNHIYL